MKSQQLFVIKNNIMRNLLLMVMICSTSFIFGQQEPHFTQYMYNSNSINPAYAGSKGFTSLYGMYRAQWVGLEGAPKTAVVSMHKPIDGTNLGFGLSVTNDKIGPSEESQFAVDFSYTLFLNNDNRVAFGLKASGNLLSIDYTRLNSYTPGELILQNNINNRFSPNIGAGVYYYNNNSYLGLSVPMILDTKRYDDVVSSSVNQRYHVYLTGGKVYNIDYHIKFKPAFVLKAVDGAPLQLDLTANFMFNDKFTVGAAYRWDSAVSGLVGFQLSKSMFVGYSYDRDTSKLVKYNSGSHEFFVMFDLFNKTQKVDTPRFF
jgi:type IX secretion system PorP/SprF family membrane protein